MTLVPCDTVVPTLIVKNSSHGSISQDNELFPLSQKDTEHSSSGSEIYVSSGSFGIILADVIIAGGPSLFDKMTQQVSHTYLSSVYSACYNNSFIVYTPNKCRNEKIMTNRSTRLFLNTGNGYDIRLLKLRDPKHKETGSSTMKWESITWSPVFDHQNGLHTSSIRISDPGQYSVQVNSNH